MKNALLGGAAIATLSVLFAACGGGGGSSAGGGAVPSAPAPASKGTLAFVIGGANATVEARRHPNFVPASMQFIDIKALFSDGSAFDIAQIPCTLASGCSASLPLPDGTYTLLVAATDAYGVILAHATVTETITGGSTTTLRATLLGNVQSMSLALASPLHLNGTPQTTKLVVTPYDFDGDVVLAPGDYASPIVLSASVTNATAPSNALTLSRTTLTSAADSIDVSYDGRSYTSLEITANLPDKTAGSPVTYHISPQLDTSEYAIPSGALVTSSLINGPDGNVWAATLQSLVRVTPSGQTTEYCTVPGASSLIAGPNGQIWFGANVSHAPAPGAAFTCPTTSLGLREMTTSGTVTTLVAPLKSSSYGTTGPLIAPDSTIWAFDTSTSTLEQISTSGTVTQSFQALLGGNPFAGYSTPQIAPDGSFWFIFSPTVVRCTAVGGCSIEPSLDPTFVPMSISQGPAGTMLLQDYGNIWDVDSSFAVQWHTNNQQKQWGATFTGPAAYFKGAVWASGWIAPDGHDQLLRVEPDGKNFSFIELPTVNSGADSTQLVGGILLGADGRLWYTRGSNVGVTAIQ